MFFLIILYFFSKEYTIDSFKKELKKAMTYRGHAIILPLEEAYKKLEENIDINKLSKKEQVKLQVKKDIIKNNSYHNKKITLTNLYIVRDKSKDNRLVFRNPSKSFVEYTYTCEGKKPFCKNNKLTKIEDGKKYKVTGKLSKYDDILKFELLYLKRIY